MMKNVDLKAAISKARDMRRKLYRSEARNCEGLYSGANSASGEPLSNYDGIEEQNVHTAKQLAEMREKMLLMKNNTVKISAQHMTNK